MDHAVRLTGVTKTFGSHTAVRDLSLAVPAGSLYGFIGPNGSGKTTTIRMILHILHPDQGEVEVLGHRETRAANDLVGYLPEERGLYKKMTVSRLLLYYASLKGMGSKDARSAMNEWLKRFELESWADKKVEALSKGMSQKVQFIS
ncbi:MAG: ATP-binding cassette domain-containing protein, partial [Planctomycetota bacterium]|nr:ATP-binding cassette domain-containing protein [Planctomycetota bacterium]